MPRSSGIFGIGVPHVSSYRGFQNPGIKQVYSKISVILGICDNGERCIQRINSICLGFARAVNIGQDADYSIILECADIAGTVIAIAALVVAGYANIGALTYHTGIIGDCQSFSPAAVVSKIRRHENRVVRRF